MRAPEKNNKGFSLIELLVVIAIVAAISGAAYPTFKSWLEGREVKQGVVKIKNAFSTIITQVQRGTYPFVQVQIVHAGKSEKNSWLEVTTKGMKQETFTSKRKQSDWMTSTDKCKMDEDNYWDNEKVSYFKIKGVAVNFVVDKSAGICFSKDGTFYSGGGEFQTADASGNVDIDNTLYICSKSEALNTTKEVFSHCRIDLNTGTEANPVIKPTERDSKYFYRISWSIFGGIEQEKWNKGKDKWTKY